MMKTKIMAGCIVIAFLVLPILSIPLSTATSISPTTGPDDRWYGGIIHIRGKFTSMERAFGPVPFCVLLNCKENNIVVSGINIEYNGWTDTFSFSKISETNFSKITIAGFYLGFCRFGRVNALAFSIMIWA